MQWQKMRRYILPINKTRLLDFLQEIQNAEKAVFQKMPTASGFQQAFYI